MALYGLSMEGMAVSFTLILWHLIRRQLLLRPVTGDFVLEATVQATRDALAGQGGGRCVVATGTDLSGHRHHAGLPQRRLGDDVHLRRLPLQGLGGLQAEGWRGDVGELAERAGLELPTVSKVLKPLAHAGLVEGVRGSSGGYRLARPPAQIRLIEIVEAIEGPLGVTECSGEHSACERESHCGVRGNWRRINQVVADALGGITLAQMRVPFPPAKAAPGARAPAVAARRGIPAQLAVD